VGRGRGRGRNLPAWMTQANQPTPGAPAAPVHHQPPAPASSVGGASGLTVDSQVLGLLDMIASSTGN
jgi:hypothetical protein